MGAEEISPQQFQQRAEALLQKHRAMDGSLLMREAKNEIMFGDIDLIGLQDFLQSCVTGNARIVHTKVVVPSRLGMSLYMSAFEDLMSMKTRAFLVKDIDPAILQRLLGTRSLATELSSEQLENYYSDKAPVPTNAKELQRLMSHGGGLDRQFNNPLYKEKLNNIPHETIRGWVEELCQAGSVTKLDGTGQDELDGKWFTPYMAEIHGTLGCLAVAGGKEVENLLELHTRGLTYKTATTFDGTKPVAWEERDLGDPQEALRVKIIEMLGSEGPKTSEEMVDRLPSLNRLSNGPCTNLKDEM